MILSSGKGVLTLLILVLGIAISQIVYELASGLKPVQQDHDLYIYAIASGIFWLRFFLGWD